ncbi:Eco57I restriction-modification methylase domain-containing protein [Halanaeroarchaeum sulfurireducens]|uniref:site-specific DNA-methyltransferase (adenine-specific) n=1 Tax=Halanaeroarchaeum sulfurireducens TaxID=1604004 RepID=A0A0F7PBH4_9EURY|nr:DNA methyltransferase [Halanaeroarchaeum sulfurireducens]AKH98042.1 type II restriction enzyme, methylase subunits [Halanaeroarchaeum sulfurireducens]ALG82436.1 type II restriction enzyme [Halanaeroarchaeum sulfurireducens]
MSSNSSSVPTEFVAESFETEVSEAEENRLIEAINDAVSNLRDQIDDDTLESLLRADAGSYVFRSSMTKDGLQPESFTQEAIINPLLDVLGHEYSIEAGGLSGGQTQVADYTISLRNHPEIESARLLVEAEPINKDLDSRKHGIGQVRDWLSQREFESDFGFATDGLRWAFVRYDPDSYTHNVIEEVNLQPVFIALFENQTGGRESPSGVLFDADRERITRLIRTFEYENFVSIAGDARQVLKQKREDITDEFYDDYIQYVFGIVGEDEETARSLVGDGVVTPDGATEDDTRLFAVELMNRLVFIKFLEDKALVNHDLLQTLVDTYESGMYAGSFYESFLQPLFYDVMNEQAGRRPDHVENIELFQDIPYLNGGLFRPTIKGEEFKEDDFDVRNSVLFSIIDLLERYSFSAGGAPTDLDPSILGNVFEKTINYITSDNADTNKELGAYYTPSEITRFSAEETVWPALLERFKNVLREEREWPEPEVEQYETVFELIEDMPSSWSLISDFLSEVDELRVVDPACGSGHFLTSVLEEIVTIRKALYSQYEEEDEDNEPYPDEYKLKKTTVLNNIYGVDLMGPAVEIAKLRLWLSVISELETENVDDLADDDALALPNIAFNLREGNSLIGYTGFPETTDDGEQYQIGSFSEDSVRDRYQDIIDEIEKHEEAIDSETAEKHRNRAFEKLRNAREELIDDIHGDFVEAGIEDITPETVEKMEPFNWVLEFAEVYADGGFDVIVGNPPWDKIVPRRDDYFTRFDSDFRTLLPEAKQTRQTELLENEEIREGWEEYKQRIETQAEYFNNSEDFQLQRPTVAGRTEATENDLSALFLERVFQIARDDGYVSQVLPGAIFNGSSAKDLRLHLLDETQVKSLVTFENKGIFPEIDNRYNFGILVFENKGSTGELKGIFKQNTLDILEEFEKISLTIPRRVLHDYSPEAAIFPYLESQDDADVLNTILRSPSIGEESNEWWVNPYSELHRGSDVDRFVESEEDGDYPVLGGSNIFQFIYNTDILESVEEPEFWSVEEDKDPEKSAKRRIREKKIRSLKRRLYDEFEGVGSQKSFVNQLLQENRGKELSLDDVLLDCTDYRIAIRNIARATDERTLIASVIPPGVVCHHAINTVQKFKANPTEDDLHNLPLHSAYDSIFTDEELFTVVGLLNSLPFDFLMRTKVDSNIVMYKLEESQAPRLTKGDEWFEYIWRRAARLNAYGEDFEEMRDRLGGIKPVTEMDERREVQAELDAAAFHAYGLDREQTAFVLDDFHRVQNPRMMDEDYFEMVLEKYDSLST